jgi:putative DNA primase/helicase
MGDYGVDLSFGTLETKHQIGEGANLPGARFAKAVEIREGRRLDEARVKSWTGGDTISVRPLYRNAFSFSPTHKLWLAFNHKPVVADNSPAIWNRIHLIPFERNFAKQGADKKLLVTLSTSKKATRFGHS